MDQWSDPVSGRLDEVLGGWNDLLSGGFGAAGTLGHVSSDVDFDSGWSFPNRIAPLCRLTGWLPTADGRRPAHPDLPTERCHRRGAAERQPCTPTTATSCSTCSPTTRRRRWPTSSAWRPARRSTRDPETGAKTTGQFYDGLVFHRVIDGFMIQGGARRAPGRVAPATSSATSSTPSCRSTSPTCWPWPTPAPGTNGSQFFITLGPTPHLNRKHTIFGEVADQASRDVVDEIGHVRDGPGRPPGRARGHRVGTFDRDLGVTQPPGAGGRTSPRPASPPATGIPTG